MNFKSKKIFVTILLASTGIVLLTNCNNINHGKNHISLYGRWGYFDNDKTKEKIEIETSDGTSFKNIKELHTLTPFISEIHQFSYWSFDIEGEKPVEDNYVINSDVDLYAQYEENLSDTATYILAQPSADDDPRITDPTKKLNVIRFCLATVLPDQVNISVDIDEKYYTITTESANKESEYVVALTFNNYHGPCIIKVEGLITRYCFALGQTTEKSAFVNYLCGGGNKFIYNIAFASTVEKIDCSGTKAGKLGGCGVAGLTNLKEIACSSFTNICGGYCFKDCTSLRRLPYIQPMDDKEIAPYCFYNCQNLKHLHIKSDILKTICDSSFKYSGIEEIVIPNGVISISQSAFSNCKSLSKVVLNDKLTAIAPYVFENCESLESVTIPKSVINFGSHIVDNCVNLEELKFEDSGTPINLSKEMIAGCDKFEYFQVPRRFTSLPQYTFINCGLKTLDLTLINHILPLEGFLFGEDTPLGKGQGKILVPENLISTYKAAPGWSDYNELIVSK